MSPLLGGMEVRYMDGVDADMDAMLALNAEWVRITVDIGVAAAAGSVGSPLTGITWPMTSVHSHAQSIGLKTMIVLTFSPPWMTSAAFGHQIPQTSALQDAWATIAAAAVTHYGADAYEIYNEPNHDPFNANPTLGTLRPFFRKAILAMRAADSGAFLMCGGPASAKSRTAVANPKWDAGTPTPGAGELSISPATYLDGLYESGGIVSGTTPGTAYVDAVAIHGYTGNTTPDYNWFENPLYHAFRNMPNVGSPAFFGSAGFNYRDHIVVARGDGAKPIWQTEAGFFGGFPTLPESTAANYMDTALTFWESKQAAGVAGPYFYFELRDNGVTNDDGTKASGNSEDYLGLYIRHDDDSFTGKPQILVWINRTTPVETPDDPDPYSYPAPKPTGPGVLWSANNQALTFGTLFGTTGLWGDFGAVLVDPLPDPNPTPPPADDDPTDPPPPATTGSLWAATLGDVTLGLEPYRWGEDGPDILGWSSMRTSDVARTGGDGASSTNPDRMETTTKTWPIMINLTTETDVLHAYQTLATAWKRSEGIQELELSTPVGRYTLFGRPRRLKPISMDFTNQGFLEVVAQFDATDPVFYSDPTTVFGTLTSTAGGLSFPFSFPFSFGGANAGGVTVTNDGNVDTDRVVIIITAGSGGLNNPRLELLATGEGLLFDLDLTDGQELWVDFYDQTIRLNNLESRSGKLIRPASSFWSLPPGSHPIRFGGVGSGQISVTSRSAHIF